MIGTNSFFRSLTLFLILAFACAGLVFVWGCTGEPFSVKNGDKNVSHNAIPVPYGHKPDVVTTVGLVEEIDHVVMRLRVDGLWFFADLETEIEVDGRKPCAFADVRPGDPAKIKHDRMPNLDGARYAREIEIERENDEPEDPEDDEVETEGFVEVIDGNRLRVTGVWFWLDEATQLEIDDKCLDGVIVTGDRVKIEHTTAIVDGLGYYADKIEVERDCEEEEDMEV